jgi:hypothetical protein
LGRSLGPAPLFLNMRPCCTPACQWLCWSALLPQLAPVFTPCCCPPARARRACCAGALSIAHYSRFVLDQVLTHLWHRGYK